MSFADDRKAEEEALRRRFIHHTRKPGPLSLQEAVDLCREIGETERIAPED